MTENHLSPDQAAKIVEDNRITAQQLDHVRLCAFCNGWLRAFAALASSGGTKISFEVPPAPSNKTPAPTKDE